MVRDNTKASYVIFLIKGSCVSFKSIEKVNKILFFTETNIYY